MTSSPSAAVPARIFDHQRVWRLEPAVFHEAAATIADSCANYEPHVVVGIARGGIPLAQALGVYLDLPALEVRARHNLSDALYVEASGQVTVAALPLLPPGIPDRPRLLVADDMCGSGVTLQAVSQALQERFTPASLRTVVLCRNAGAALQPSCWVWDTRDWVVFGWNEQVDQPTEPLPWPVAVKVGSDQ